MRLVDYLIVALVAIAFILALIYCIKNPNSECKNCEKYGQCALKRNKCPKKDNKDQ